MYEKLSRQFNSLPSPLNKKLLTHHNRALEQLQVGVCRNCEVD